MNSNFSLTITSLCHWLLISLFSFLYLKWRVSIPNIHQFMLVCRIKSDLHKINRLLLYTNCIKRVIIKPVIIKQLFSSTYFFSCIPLNQFGCCFCYNCVFFFSFHQNMYVTLLVLSWTFKRIFLIIQKQDQEKDA